MKKIILLLALLPTLAFAQAELEPRVNANENSVQALAAQVDQNTADLEKAFLVDAQTLRALHDIDTNYKFFISFTSVELYSCFQIPYPTGCDTVTSGNGTIFSGTLRYETSQAVVTWLDTITGRVVWAVPVNIANGFAELRFVSQANMWVSRSRTQILVDDCDNPTVAYVNPDPELNSRPGFPLGNAPSYIMDNSGRAYRRSSNTPNPVDVTGNTYGRINFVIHSEDTNPTPICTPGISDREGVWNEYPYGFVYDTNDPRFAGPFTYTGTSIGLIDRVEALENP